MVKWCIERGWYRPVAGFECGLIFADARYSLALPQLPAHGGIGGLPPGAPAPYHAVGHLFFRTLADLQSALAATAADFIADERNYTDVPSVVQISEVVE
jgi:hypothetical protein